MSRATIDRERNGPQNSDETPPRAETGLPIQGTPPPETHQMGACVVAVIGESAMQEHKLVKAAREAVAIAKCDHAFVMTPMQPKDRKWVRVFCPRCEGTFTVSATDDTQHHP